MTISGMTPTAALPVAATQRARGIPLIVIGTMGDTPPTDENDASPRAVKLAE
jgi:hypothetical protein